MLHFKVLILQIKTFSIKKSLKNKILSVLYLAQKRTIFLFIYYIMAKHNKNTTPQRKIILINQSLSIVIDYSIINGIVVLPTLNISQFCGIKQFAQHKLAHNLII